MKQKTIIQIWGRQGCGKTTTIKFIREELRRRYIDSSHTYSFDTLPRGEISDRIQCGDFLVGIESMGDDLWAGRPHDKLHDRLNGYVLDCDVIVCASRVYNNVSKHIEWLARENGFRIIKATNYRQEGDDRAFQNELNLYSARQISDLLDEVLNGGI